MLDRASACKACDRVTHSLTSQGYCYTCDDELRGALEMLGAQITDLLLCPVCAKRPIQHEHKYCPPCADLVNEGRE